MRTMPDMKVVTVRELSRNTAEVLNALERGEKFEVRRNGRAVGYLTQTAPTVESRPDWNAHFEWLRKQPADAGKKLLQEFEEERRTLSSREESFSK